MMIVWQSTGKGGGGQEEKEEGQQVQVQVTTGAPVRPVCDRQPVCACVI
jgi:hypothetical protein